MSTLSGWCCSWREEDTNDPAGGYDSAIRAGSKPSFAKYQSRK
jgi:hypothetical protein